MTTPGERLAALDAAVRGPDRERAILLALEDEALPVRERAIRLAARYVEPAVLAAMVADGQNAVRRNAGLGALERQGPYAVPHLSVMLGDSDPELVMFAVQSLARIGHAPAGRSILPLLQHPDPNVAQSAIEAVGQLRTREAVPALLKLVNGELWLQLAAINALGAIGAPEAVQPLMALVPDSVLAEPAVQALKNIAAPESLEPLLGLLPVVHERALRDPLLLAIAVVIDLHPDPAPLLAGAGSALAASDEAMTYLARILAAVAEDVDGEGDSLPRAAATLSVAAGLEALEPGLLARLASDPTPAGSRDCSADSQRGSRRGASACWVIRIRTFGPECSAPRDSTRTSCRRSSIISRMPTHRFAPPPATPWDGSSWTARRRFWSNGCGEVSRWSRRPRSRRWVACRLARWQIWSTASPPKPTRRWRRSRSTCSPPGR